MRTAPRSRERGVSLIELMIAMSIVAIGLLAMWQLHFVGITSTAAARRHTVATALAAELVSGLERLAFTDPLLSEAGSGPTAPTPFGQLVSGTGAIATGAHEWDDASSAVPGVRRSADIVEMSDRTSSYARRWTVWAVSDPGGRVGAKVIAVSITWNDPPLLRPREVVQYGYVPNVAVIGTVLGSAP